MLSSLSTITVARVVAKLEVVATALYPTILRLQPLGDRGRQLRPAGRA